MRYIIPSLFLILFCFFFPQNIFSSDSVDLENNEKLCVGVLKDWRYGVVVYFPFSDKKEADRWAFLVNSNYKRLTTGEVYCRGYKKHKKATKSIPKRKPHQQKYKRKKRALV